MTKKHKHTKPKTLNEWSESLARASAAMLNADPGSVERRARREEFKLAIKGARTAVRAAREERRRIRALNTATHLNRRRR